MTKMCLKYELDEMGGAVLVTTSSLRLSGIAGVEISQKKRRYDYEKGACMDPLISHDTQLYRL